MSFSRRTNDKTRIIKGLEHGSDSVSPNSPVKHSSRSVYSDTPKETSETRQQRRENTTKKKDTPERVGDGNAARITGDLSEITRTNDTVAAKEKVSYETHGVLKVPESLRTVYPMKKGPSSIQAENCAKSIVNDGTLIHTIGTCEINLNNSVSRWSGDPAKLQNIIAMSIHLEQLWRKVIEDGKEHIDCSRIWQSCHYIITETFRRHLPRKSYKGLKEEFVKFLESSMHFYTSLVELLQASEGSTGDSQSRRKGKMSILMCHHFNIYIGDLCRYREQLATRPNWAKPRSYYLKAQQLAPKNGKPYNQLAVIAIHAHRRLDAVYYYVRSLTASNPFLSAKESLAALFDETSKKAEKEEEKVKIEKEQKMERRERKQKRMPENDKSKEVWLLPWQVDKIDDVQSSATSSDLYSPSPSTEEFIPEQPNPELIKNLASSVLIVHGKLYTKIGLETVTDAVEKCLSTWRLVLHHQLSVNDTSRFLKMFVLCLFSLHNVAEREQASTSACLYYCGLAGTFLIQFLHEVFQTCNALLASFTEGELKAPNDATSSAGTAINDGLPGNDLSKISGDKVQQFFDQLICYLPLVKVWYNWLTCQSQLWSISHQEIKNEIVQQFWKANEELLNYLNNLPLFPHPNTLEAVTTGASVPLWEDKSLAGFMPLKGLPVQPMLTTDNANQMDSLTEGLQRIKIILQTSKQLFSETDRDNTDNDEGRTLPLIFDGYKFLLQEQSSVSTRNNALISHYKDSTTVTVQEKIDSDNDSVIVDDGDDQNHNYDHDPGTHHDVVEQGVLSDIERLRMEKEKLTRRLQDQRQTKQDIEQVLETRSKQEVTQQKIIIPKYIVPDTNCFIFDLISIQRLVGSGHFTVVIPLTVLMELEGLMKGSTSRTDAPTEGAKIAVDYLKQCFEAKERCVKLLTTKGNFLTTMSIRSEMTGIQISNDDYILLSSVNLHSKVDSQHKASGATVSNRYSVTLLTDDRNLRVKAYAQEFPVKGLTEFMDWCKL